MSTILPTLDVSFFGTFSSQKQSEIDRSLVLLSNIYRFVFNNNNFILEFKILYENLSRKFRYSAGAFTIAPLAGLEIDFK